MSTITFIEGPTIAADASLSDAIDCSQGAVVRITMPSQWTSAVLGFLISKDNIAPYSFLCHADGRECTVAVQPGSTIIGVRIPAGWVKFRSGTAGQPVPQPVLRRFRVALEVGAPV